MPSSLSGSGPGCDARSLVDLWLLSRGDPDTWSSSPLQIERPSVAGVESLDNGSQLLLVANNRSPRAGELRVTATVFSEELIGTRDEVARALVPGNSAVTVVVPVSRLALPQKSLRFSGLLTFTASIHYDNGATENASPALDLYFHPQGGGWLVYGEEEKQERFHGGALRAEDRARYRRGTRFGPAFARKVSDDTGWRQVSDDGPGGTLPSNQTKQAVLKICVEQMSAFSDAGVGEDYWQSSASTARPSRGAWVVIRRGSDYLKVGFLGDGRGSGGPGPGCTEDLDEPVGTHDYDFQIFTVGRVQDNAINTAYEGNPVLDWNFTRSLTGGGPHVVTFDPTASTGKAFDVYMVGAYSLYRHVGGVSNEAFAYRLQSGTSNSSVDRFNDIIKIGEDNADKKFIIAHETGHLLGDFATGNNNWKTVSTKCQCYNSSSCPTPPFHGDHTMISKERSRCAMAEGFAHFYSAAVFNQHRFGHYDCWFHYYKEIGGDNDPTVDCDEANGPFDVQYMESNCASPWIGMGTELDWMRTFWDMLSADSPTPGDPPLEMYDIVHWIDLAEYWHDYYAYNNLNAAANVIGGDLNTHWDWFAPINGIDWPRNGLLFTDGFETGKIECWSDQ